MTRFFTSSLCSDLIRLEQSRQLGLYGRSCAFRSGGYSGPKRKRAAKRNAMDILNRERVAHGMNRYRTSKARRFMEMYRLMKRFWSLHTARQKAI